MSTSVLPLLKAMHHICLSVVENSKYGTRNTFTMGSTTGMNNDMQLIQNNNHVIGVTDEVREIAWF